MSSISEEILKLRKEAYDRAHSDIVKVIRKNASLAKGQDGESVLLSLADAIEASAFK